ncbi:TetR/AcrR family transcriptional regulator [Aestuariirhabdus sp. Z084]|uniref:TetR/AcrR family transcriptional regulator n=1 Tax=Aestuariirhabdus haliotis TaxID=2918751 RepID=UPI00201B3FB2|nr:TetR/AcrR family transcriptional regulator [Aestuariirhabdus haliotis]MCL6415347.1 TetR/AcrR family transcriptional regulator [Aestuariirhabdus haliotis]MCL6419103.1 TetR/AcrR family transcriptional regulator [Aestuariirhabdus haliotis]
MAYRATPATEARKKEVHQRLLHSAFKIVSREGFSGLSISAVARESNLATGTLYRYFRNKAELCVALFSSASQHEVDQVAEAAMRHEDAAANLADAIETFSRRALSNPRLAWALIAEPADALVDKARLSYREAYADVFAQILQQGISQQRFDCDQPGLIASALVGALSESLLGPLSTTSAHSDHNSSIQQLQRFSLQALNCNPLPQLTGESR